MKRLGMLAFLTLALLAAILPSTVLADSKHTVSATASVVAVDRQITGFDPATGHMTGIAYYQGIVQHATRDAKDWAKLEGSTVSAQENFDYYIDATGTIVYGAVIGSLTIVGPDHSIARISFQSQVSGNIVTGPASDIGSWKVKDAKGFLHILEDASGSWAATVNMVQVAPGVYTFAGSATLTGVLDD